MTAIEYPTNQELRKGLFHEQFWVETQTPWHLRSGMSANEGFNWLLGADGTRRDLRPPVTQTGHLTDVPTATLNPGFFDLPERPGLSAVWYWAERTVVAYHIKTGEYWEPTTVPVLPSMDYESYSDWFRAHLQKYVVTPLPRTYYACDDDRVVMTGAFAREYSEVVMGPTLASQVAKSRGIKSGRIVMYDRRENRVRVLRMSRAANNPRHVAMSPDKLTVLSMCRAGASYVIDFDANG